MCRAALLGGGGEPGKAGLLGGPGRGGDSGSEDEPARAGQRRAEARLVGVAVHRAELTQGRCASRTGSRDRTCLIPHSGACCGDPGRLASLGDWPAVTLESMFRARKRSPWDTVPSDLGFLHHNTAKHGFPLRWPEGV